MSKSVSESSLRYHIEGSDCRRPSADDWHFLEASDYLDYRGGFSLPNGQEDARDIERRWLTSYRWVRIVDRTRND